MRKQVEESTAAESARRATGAAAERDRRGRDKAVHPRTIARDAVARPPLLLCRPARRVSPPRPRGLALSWRGSTGRLDAVSTAPPSRCAYQRSVARSCAARSGSAPGAPWRWPSSSPASRRRPAVSVTPRRSAWRDPPPDSTPR